MSVILNAQRAQVECVEIAGRELPGLRAWTVNNRVGESPTWDARTQTLLWIDVRAPEVLRLEPGSSMVTRWRLPEVVGALGLAQGGAVVLALMRSLALLDLKSGLLSPLLTIEEEPEGNRLNDGKVSPSGRWFVFGSMDDRAERKQATGALYCAGGDRSVRRLIGGLTVANGIAWTPDGALIFFSDSHAGKVWKASWDEEHGSVGRPELFCESGEGAGRPDGAAVDLDGNYWSAGVSAGRLNRFDPLGNRQSSFALPCRAPTMPCFGAEDLDRIFVTSLVRAGWVPGTETLDGALFSFSSKARGHVGSPWMVSTVSGDKERYKLPQTR